MEFVGLMVLFVAAGFLAPLVRGKLTDRKSRRYAAGEATRISVRARGPYPLPERWAWGSVDTTDDPLRFRRWHRLRPSAPLTGLRLLRRSLGGAPNAPEPLTVFHLRDAAGRRVELGVYVTHAELFESVLRRLPAPLEHEVPPVRTRRRPWIRITLAVLAGLWLLACAYFFTAGSALDLRALELDEDGYCRVEWTRDGRPYDTWVDCWGKQVGDTVHVLTMPPPFVGEAAHYTELAVSVPIVAVPLLVPLGWYGLRRRRREEPEPVFPERLPTLVDEVDAPSLQPHELRWSTIAPAVERRAADEEWDLSSTATWWERRVRSTLAQGALRSMVRIVVPVLLALLAIGLSWTSIDTARTFSNANAVEIVGTVELVDGFMPPVPWDVEVAFEIDGHPEHVRVSTLREPEEGDTLTIRYDPEHDVARPDEHDGTERGVLLVSIGVSLALAYSAYRVVKLVRVLRMLGRSRREPPVEMRYAIVLDEIGAPAVLLFDAGRDVRPAVAVPFRHLPAMPVTGTVLVHGPVEQDTALVIRIGDELLYPDGPAFGLDTESLLWAVTGEAPAVGYDDETDEDG